MNKRNTIRLFIVTVLTILTYASIVTADTEAIKARILPLREQAKIQNEWLDWRFENILPGIMRDAGIDLWVIINREYNEDPVYMSMVPEPHMFARRTSILIFHDLGAEKGVDRLSGGYYGIGDFYKPTWLDKTKKQFESLAEFIKTRNPQKSFLYFECLVRKLPWVPFSRGNR